jgi:hypothetical protein
VIGCYEIDSLQRLCSKGWRLKRLEIPGGLDVLDVPLAPGWPKGWLPQCPGFNRLSPNGEGQLSSEGWLSGMGLIRQKGVNVIR